MHTDGKKRRSFVAMLFAAGDLQRMPRKINLPWQLLFYDSGDVVDNVYNHG
jgi:hypothetical protein